MPIGLFCFPNIRICYPKIGLTQLSFNKLGMLLMMDILLISKSLLFCIGILQKICLFKFCRKELNYYISLRIYYCNNNNYYYNNLPHTAYRIF